VTQQSIVIREDEDVDDVLNAINEAEYPLVVQIGPYARNRTLKQNALLWVWMGRIQTQMRDAFGQYGEPDEWHETLVRRLLPKRVKYFELPDGTTYWAGRTSTRHMNTKQFAEYLNLLEAYCADILELQLPHPDDLYWDALLKDQETTNG
jgi:hypothetical protein